MLLSLEAKLIAGAGALAILLGLFGWWSIHERRAGEAAIKAQVAQATIKAQQQAAAETDRRLTASKDQDHEDQAHAERQVDARAAVDAAIGRLRVRVAASAGPVDPAASAVGSGIKAPGVPPDVLGSLAEAAGRYADIAEQALGAAESCAARYDSLTPK